jgi:hypothetical protein
MTKLAQFLGSGYEQKRTNIFTRQFELGGHTFKVRVPLIAESDEIYKRVMEPDAQTIDRLYHEMTDPLQKFKPDATDESGFVFTETDVLVSGRSMREAAKNKAMTEARITEYIKLLIPENPENSLDDLTYADIELEFPMSVQLLLCEKIGEAISPTYKEARGN